MSMDVCRDLYRAYPQAPYLWLDDVYITGIVAKVANITSQDWPQAFTRTFDDFRRKYTRRNIFFEKPIFSHLNGYRASAVHKVHIVWDIIRSEKDKYGG